ncbi:TonB-dependent receptor plug domain-containing protein [Bergeyella porcorum]|uniref:TonB-dependent receptor plug domain-containing protein n=1 Tax=Bergeyella porcorum TaxID=1735111 RepID=UPI0035ED4A98
MKKLILSTLVITSVFAYSQEKKDSLSTKDIQEVLIKSQRKKQFADHANYTFDKEALEKARHSKDLLTTLPELQLDPISNTVTSIKGGKILFLINGIEASDNQIKSIAPTNVVRVEYFDIPPARYSQRADTVVNIVTKNPEVGYSYGADIISALATGFVNGSAYAGYTKGKNDFGLEYSINLRDYDNRIVDKIYDYNLNGSHYNSTEQQKDHFGYTNQNIALRYANVDPGNYTFQAKGSVFINSSFNKGLGQSVFTKDNLSENHSTIHNSNSAYTAPTLDLYYSKNIGKKDELSINLIGSHYTTNSSQFDHEWRIADNVDIFNNDMNLKAKQTGIVGEIAYTHQFEKGKLSSGYRISNTAISNDLVNLLGASHYNVNYLTQYLYSEYSGKWNKLSYRLGIGVTNIHNKSAETTQDDWAPTPKLVLSYDLKKNQSFRFTSSYTSNSPWASALSSNISQIVPNIVQRGNPYLKSQHLFRNNLIYSYGGQKLDVNVNAFYNRVDRYFAEIFVTDTETNGYALTYQNADFNEGGIQVSGSYKPFGNNILKIQAFVQPVNMRLKVNDGRVFNNSFVRSSFAFISEIKSFTIFYRFNLPIYQISGAFLSLDENNNDLFVQYKKGDFSVYAGFYWLGTPSHYHNKTLEGSIVRNERISNIYNNKNMFVLGMSYDFSSGKKLQIQKKLNNSTAPAATF